MPPYHRPLPRACHPPNDELAIRASPTNVGAGCLGRLTFSAGSLVCQDLVRESECERHDRPPSSGGVAKAASYPKGWETQHAIDAVDSRSLLLGSRAPSGAAPNAATQDRSPG